MTDQATLTVKGNLNTQDFNDNHLISARKYSKYIQF